MPKLYVKLEQKIETAAGADKHIPPQNERGPARIRVRLQDYQAGNEKIIKLFHFSLVAVVLLALIAAFLQAGSLRWFWETKSIDSVPIDDFTLALAPLLALTLAIERVIETLFSYFESKLESVAKFSNLGVENYSQMEKELRNAMDSYQAIVKQLAATQEEAERESLRQKAKRAEDWVKAINQRIGAILKDPRYLAFKQRLSIWLGFALGFVVAILTDRGLFEYLRIGVPRIVDVVITGAVLGAGTGPMHSVVGVLDGLKGILRNFTVSAK